MQGNLNVPGPMGRSRIIGEMSAEEDDDLGTRNVDGRTNAQVAMSDAEEERAGERNECTGREVDAKHRTKAEHDDDRMRER